MTLLVATSLMVWTLSAGGFDALDAVITVLFAMTVPFNAIAFWNAVIGLILMRTKTDLATAINPQLADASDRSPVTAQTALLSCIRNEDADTVGRNLDLMIEDLVASGAAPTISRSTC
jgi:membrane glycosyltransferase